MLLILNSHLIGYEKKKFQKIITQDYWFLETNNNNEFTWNSYLKFKWDKYFVSKIGKLLEKDSSVMNVIHILKHNK